MNPLQQDTSSGQTARYFQLLRALTPAQRLRIVSATTRRMRSLAVAGIRLRQPGLSEVEVKGALVELLYGAEVRARLGGKLGGR
jgi:hypothetical protein